MATQKNNPVITGITIKGEIFLWLYPKLKWMPKKLRDFVLDMLFVGHRLEH